MAVDVLFHVASSSESLFLFSDKQNIQLSYPFFVKSRSQGMRLLLENTVLDNPEYKQKHKGVQ